MIKPIIALTLASSLICASQLSVSQASQINYQLLNAVTEVKPLQKLIFDYCGLQYHGSLNEWNSVVSCAVSGNGKYLAVACRNDHMVYILDAKTFICVAQLVHTSKKTIIAIAYSGDGKTLACCDKNGTVYFWDATNFYCKKSIKLFVGPKQVPSIAYSADNKLVTIDPEKNTKIYCYDIEAKGGTYIGGSEDEIMAFALEPRGKRIACTSENAVRIYNFGTKLVRPDEIACESVKAVAYSPDGNYLATTADDKKITLYDVTDIKNSRMADQFPEESERAIQALTYGPDGKLFAADDTGIKIYAPMQLLKQIFGDVSLRKSYTNFIVRTDKEIAPVHTPVSVPSNEEASLQLVRQLEEEASLQLARELDAKDAAARHTETRRVTYKQSYGQAAQQHKEWLLILFPLEKTEYSVTGGVLRIQEKWDNECETTVVWDTKLAHKPFWSPVTAQLLEETFPLSYAYCAKSNGVLQLRESKNGKVIKEKKIEENSTQNESRAAQLDSYRQQRLLAEQEDTASAKRTAELEKSIAHKNPEDRHIALLLILFPPENTQYFVVTGNLYLRLRYGESVTDIKCENTVLQDQPVKPVTDYVLRCAFPEDLWHCKIENSVLKLCRIADGSVFKRKNI